MRERYSENLHQTLPVTQPACSKFQENYNELVATPSASRGTGFIAELAEKECRPEAELRSAGADEASAPTRAFAIHAARRDFVSAFSWFTEHKSIAHREVNERTHGNRQNVRHKVVQLRATHQNSHEHDISEYRKQSSRQIELRKPAPRACAGAVPPRESLMPQVVVEDCRFYRQGCRDQVVQLQSGFQQGQNAQLNEDPACPNRVKLHPADPGSADGFRVAHRIRSSQ